MYRRGLDEGVASGTLNGMQTKIGDGHGVATLPAEGDRWVKRDGDGGAAEAETPISSGERDCLPGIKGSRSCRSTPEHPSLVIVNRARFSIGMGSPLQGGNDRIA